MDIFRITEKGQITIPAWIRKQLNIHSGDKVRFVLNESGNVTILPEKETVTILKGCCPRPEKPVSVEQMNQCVQTRRMLS